LLNCKSDKYISQKFLEMMTFRTRNSRSDAGHCGRLDFRTFFLLCSVLWL